MATIKRDKLREIATIKMPDLNAYTVETANEHSEGYARKWAVIEGLICLHVLKI